MKALIVTGDASARSKLVSVLERRGYDVTAQIPAQSLPDPAGELPALVVLDLDDPAWDALAYGRELRAQPEGDRIILIALATDPANRAVDAATVGFDDLVCRGSRLQALAARLELAEARAARWRAQLAANRAKQDVEDALATERDLFQAVIESAPDLLYVKDRESRFIRANAAVAAYLGVSDPSEVIGRTDFDFFPPELARKYRDDEIRVLMTGEPICDQLECREDEDSPAWVLTTKSPLRNRRGEIVGIVGVARIMTERVRAEALLRAAEARYRALVEQIPAIPFSIAVVDGEYRVTYIGPQVTSILGYEAEQIVARWSSAEYVDLIHPDDRAQFLANLERSADSLTAFHAEFRHRAKDGAYVWLRCDAGVVVDGSGAPPTWHGVMFDLTPQKEAEAKYRALIEQIPAITYTTTVEDGVERFTYVSPQIATILGYDPATFLGMELERWVELIHPDDRDRAYGRLRLAGISGLTDRSEYRVRTKDERWVWLRDEATRLSDDVSGPQHWQGVLIDLTESKALAAKLQYQAFHDPLTGLPNRALFSDRLERAILRSQRQQSSVAVLFFDLDNFKVVNDSLGHDAGDALLVAVAKRLTRIVRAGDTIARLGGDEFTIVMEDVRDPMEAVSLAQRVVRSFAAPFDVAGREVYTGASVGIAIGEGGQKSSSDLLREADVAMYQAKRAGKGSVRTFDSAIDEVLGKRLSLEQDLRRAVEREEFVVYYQPIVALPSGAPVGVEALVRWRHPERGIVLPHEFVPLAEEIGLILPIGKWVLSEACRQARIWQEHAGINPPLVVSVNLSVRQFHHPELLKDVTATLQASGLDASLLQLEITESVLMDDVDGALATLQRLHELGVRLALDDFGTGYSSLSHLKRLPIDVIKIDKSFVRGLGGSAKDALIAQSIVGLGRVLGMDVAGEGIETADQYAQLRELGFTQAQGHYLARPQEAEETEVAVRRLLAKAIGTRELAARRAEAFAMAPRWPGWR